MSSYHHALHLIMTGITINHIDLLIYLMNRHQYEAYKQQLLRCDGIPPRERSPRARRFFHRRQPRGFEYNGRNDGRRRRRPADNFQKESNQEQNIENSENKQKSRRRFNRNRKSKKPTEQNKIDENSGSLQLIESNLTTLLSELNMGNKPLNTANSTSSESLDFEKINTEDTNMCSTALAAASSRLAATFSKGN